LLSDKAPSNEAIHASITGDQPMEFRRIKLYHFPASRSARVKWLLHELLDDDFDVEPVALYDGVQYTAEYLQKILTTTCRCWNLRCTMASAIACSKAAQ
jgi:hypothetical protein